MKLGIPVIVVAVFSITIISISINDVFAVAPIITITGDQNPIMERVHSLIVHVEGKPYNNGESTMTIYPKSQGSGTVLIPVTFYEGDNRITINLIDYGFGAGLNANVLYVFEVQNLNVISTFEFTPREKQTEESLPSTDVTKQNASVRIIEITEGELTGTIKFKLCAKQDITRPQFYVYSDSKKLLYGIDIELKAGDCITDSVTILAKSPKTINIPIAEDEPTTGNLEEAIEKLRTEIAELKEQISKKDAVLMEQLRVISDLANVIKNVIYEQFVSLFSF